MQAPESEAQRIHDHLNRVEAFNTVSIVLALLIIILMFCLVGTQSMLSKTKSSPTHVVPCKPTPNPHPRKSKPSPKPAHPGSVTALSE